ncbi:GMC family oxidoreductase [Phenylobacterium sp. LjRoot219]|uniref:FAD-dependent oxidoreductase n=1 Tax=Phenylobacterium sp. LjRoot219 TaxID=3342283 RepID=UPI003ECE488C
MGVVDLHHSRSLGSSEPDECDVCIVGSGPAGSTLAAELSGTRLRVTLLESGGFTRTAAADALDEIDNVGRPRAASAWSVRNRIVGGSSHTWGGRCAPFDEIDFAQRPWTPHSGWPLSYPELAPYMARSAAHLGLGVGDGYCDQRFWRLAGRAPPANDPDPSVLLPFFWQFSRDPDESYPYEYMRFGRGLAQRLGDNVTLIAGATVLRVEPTASGGAVQAVLFADPQGRLRRLHASHVVLCAGGIENVRILLSSDTVTPNGLGNDRDLVGRFLMDHLRGVLGEIAEDPAGRLKKRFGRYNVGRNFFRAGLRLSPEVQRDEQLLNCAAWLGEALSPDDPWAAMRRIAGGAGKWPQDAIAVVGNAGLVLGGAFDYFVHRNGVPRKLEALELVCMCEQLPDPDSRITLSERRNPFGVRLPRVDWRVHELETRTLVRTAELVAAEFARLGLPPVKLADWAREGAELPSSFVDVAHPSGGTRMSEDPACGVVDANGQVHGVEGLYVAGSSVFPTVGHCNPTQTIVALAIRLADRLKRRSVQQPIAVRAKPAAPRPQRVLVTGATGRIGRWVVADLLERGYRVCAVSSKSPPAAGPWGGELEWRRFDFATAGPADYDALVSGCDAVAHLAAELGKKQLMWRVNVEATRWLAQAAARAGLGAFCYVSSISVYGSGRRRAMDEDAPVLATDRDVPSEYLAMDYVRAYGRTKLAGERALRKSGGRLPCVVLRPSVVVDLPQLIGIRDWSLAKRTLHAHRHAHHVYVRDVSAAIVWALERGWSGEAPGEIETYNLAEDAIPDATYAAFMRRAYAASGDRRWRVLPAPGLGDWLVDLARFRQLTLRRPLWRMRFPNTRLLAAGYRFGHGMARAHDLALARLCEAPQPPPQTLASPIPCRPQASAVGLEPAQETAL